MNIDDIFELMISKNVSDLFIRAGGLIRGRIDNIVVPLETKEVRPEKINSLVENILDVEAQHDLKRKKNSEFVLWYKDRWRFRVSVFFQRNNLTAVIRKIDLKLSSFEELNLPEKLLIKLCKEKRGLVLLTGTTGSGKSTTIATMIDHINNNFGSHILTIEEPIEFTFSDKKSVINQREIGKDVFSYQEALKQFALHSPDVIFIGNIRDSETCHAALTAAETGVLVFSTIHTVNAFSTIKRIVNFFPPHQQGLIRGQLASLLKGVVSQRLLPMVGGGLVPAYESMYLSPSVARLIREDKEWEIPKYMATGEVYGMKSFNQSLLELVETKKVLPQVALEYSDKKEDLEIELHNKNLL